jgi:hypothetical protein
MSDMRGTALSVAEATRLALLFESCVCTQCGHGHHDACTNSYTLHSGATVSCDCICKVSKPTPATVLDRSTMDLIARALLNPDGCQSATQCHPASRTQPPAQAPPVTG